MIGVDERFNAENSRLWDSGDVSYRSSERGTKMNFDSRAQQRPKGKPFAGRKTSALFGNLVSLLPLEDGDEIDKFASRLRRFTIQHGPLSVGSSRDENDKAIVWYAARANDPIACEILMNQGAATSAFVKAKDDDESPFEHACAMRYDRVVEVMNGWAQSELSDVSDTPESHALAAKIQADLDKSDCPTPPCPSSCQPVRCRKVLCYSQCVEQGDCCGSTSREEQG